MTGSQEHHLEVRAKTLEHMETNAPLVLGHIRGRSSAMSKFSSVKEYVQYTKNGQAGYLGYTNRTVGLVTLAKDFHLHLLDHK